LQPADGPAFEVASIKPRVGERAPGGPSSPDRFTNTDATLVDLVRFAHDVQEFQVLGGPDWIRADRWDVAARAPGPASQAEMRQMVARLLSERFGLRMHGETRDMPIYELRMARDDRRLGPRMRPSAIDCAAMLEAGQRSGAAGSTPPPCNWRVGITKTIATMVLDGAPMRRFALLLQPMLRRIVKEETGLTGTFDLQLDFAADQMNVRLPLPADAPAPPLRDGLSLFTALEEQLGLKLESTRGPVGVLVVDAVQQPSPD
jgi:uncharacterized protein (TIGR03435 family)